MARTFVRQYQSLKSDVYDDAVSPGVAMESASTDIETDLNALRSQVKRYAGETKWYTDKSGRDLKTTASDLLDLEGKKLLFRARAGGTRSPRSSCGQRGPRPAIPGCSTMTAILNC